MGEVLRGVWVDFWGRGGGEWGDEVIGVHRWNFFFITPNLLCCLFMRCRALRIICHSVKGSGYGRYRCAEGESSNHPIIKSAD